MNGASPGIMAHWGTGWFHTSRLGFATSGTAYLVAFAVASLLTAPLSELFGRKHIYQAATALSAVLFVPQALTHSLAVLIVVRCFVSCGSDLSVYSSAYARSRGVCVRDWSFHGSCKVKYSAADRQQGAAASAGNALIGGTIADLFPASSRSLPMNLFVLANFIGQSAGGVVLGWVGEDAGIQWCYGVQGLALAAGVAGTLLLSETRADVLLTRRAQRLRKQGIAANGVPGKFVARAEIGQKHVAEMVALSCWRPLRECSSSRAGPLGPDPKAPRAGEVGKLTARIPLHGAHRVRALHLDRLQLGHDLPRDGVDAARVRAVHVQHRAAGHGAADDAGGRNCRLRVLLGPGAAVPARVQAESNRAGQAGGKAVLCRRGRVPLPRRHVLLRVDGTAGRALDRAGDLLLAGHGGRQRDVRGCVVSTSPLFRLLPPLILYLTWDAELAALARSR